MLATSRFIVVNRHSFGSDTGDKPKNDPFSSIPHGSAKGTDHETGLFTTFNLIPLSIPMITKNWQAIYLRFCFHQMRHGWDIAV